MAEIDKKFKHLCEKIFSEGREYENKNRGVKRLQIPSYTFRHSFSEGFPALTNKKLYWKGIVVELLWFLQGQTNIQYLKKHGVAIWDKDAYNQYVKVAKQNTGEDANHLYHQNEDGSFRMFTIEEFLLIISNSPSVEHLIENYSWQDYVLGDVGKNYSYQWRNFGGKTDQILDLVNDMRKDIMSSRLKVNAWNPSEIFDTALPPCHSEFQIIGVPLTFEERRKIWQGKQTEKTREFAEVAKVDDAYLTEVGIPEFGFEVHWNQRSVDVFLGLPFNIASYGLLATILEMMTGYPALGIEGTLKCVHFYDNQYEAGKELVSRDENAHPNCTLEIDDYYIIPPSNYIASDLKTLFSGMEPKMFRLVGYSSDDAIKVDMLAPKEI